MANTTLRSLTAISGTSVDNADLFLVHDYSANTEYKVSLTELRTAVGNVGSGAFTISSSGTSDALIVSSNDADSTFAPDIIFYRDSSSPAANDYLGDIIFRGKNTSSANITYSMISSSINTATAGSESGNIIFLTADNGVVAQKLIIRGDGNIGIGSNGSASNILTINKPITGAATAYGISVVSTSNTDVSYVIPYRSSPSTIASATPYTVSEVRHFYAGGLTVGANSTITNQTGFHAAGSTAATNNHGFFAVGATAANVTSGKLVTGYYSNNPIATGGGSSWNFYANGDAPNYMNGVLTIGTSSPNAAAKVQIDSTTQGFLPPRMTTTQRNAISSPPAGLMIYNSTTNKLNFYNGTAWEAVTSA